MRQRPVVVGLNVCKDIIVDKATGHVTLVNRVQTIRAATWLLATVKDLVYPRVGRYEFLLLADGEWFASSAITVLKKGERQ